MIGIITDLNDDNSWPPLKYHRNLIISLVHFMVLSIGIRLHVGSLMFLIALTVISRLEAHCAMARQHLITNNGFSIRWIAMVLYICHSVQCCAVKRNTFKSLIVCPSPGRRGGQPWIQSKVDLLLSVSFDRHCKCVAIYCAGWVRSEF